MLLNELLEVGQDLHEVTVARPPIHPGMTPEEVEAVVRWAEAVEEAWQAATGEGRLEVRHRALVRLAATHATITAARTVDLMYHAGGGTAVYATSPLQRQFRDIHVVTQHMMVAPATLEVTGRILFGLDADTSTL